MHIIYADKQDERVAIGSLKPTNCFMHSDTGYQIWMFVTRVHKNNYDGVLALNLVTGIAKEFRNDTILVKQVESQIIVRK